MRQLLVELFPARRLRQHILGNMCQYLTRHSQSKSFKFSPDAVATRNTEHSSVQFPEFIRSKQTDKMIQN